MTHHAFISALLAGALSVTAVTVSAQTGDRPEASARDGAMQRFDALDADGDGRVTADELRARADDRFAAADADGDGALTLEEMVAAETARHRTRIEARAARMLDRHDADGDGTLSAAELTERRNGSRMIARLDTDGDGAVSREEFREAGAERRARRGDHGETRRGDAPRD